MDLLFETFPLLETEQLRLRKLTKADAYNVFEYFSDDEVTRYFGIENFTDPKDAEQIIETFNSSHEKRIAIRWGIAKKDTNEIIGSIGVHNINKNHSRLEIGYEITRKEWNKGYASEALKVVTSFMFDVVRVHRIGATVRPENIPSQRLLEKLGFEREGTLRDYQFTRGEYHDLIMYSLIKDSV